MAENLPTTTYKKTNDIPFQQVTDTYYGSKNITQASKILAQSTGFTDRGIRYFLKKLEVHGQLEPSRLLKPSAKHIESVNKERAKHGVAPSKIAPPAPPQPPKKKQEQIMLTVHVRVESDGLGRAGTGKGISPAYFEASFSRIVNLQNMQSEMYAMFQYLKDKISGTPNYDRFNQDRDMTEYVMGTETEDLDSTNHHDGELDIPLHPKRFKPW